MTWVAVGTAAAIGAGVGAGSGIIQGDDPDEIFKRALIGGATGAVTGGISSGAESTVAPELLSQAGPELVNTAAVNAIPLDTVVQQATPELLSSAAGIEQITPEMMNAVNLGYADSLAAQGTGVQSAGINNIGYTPTAASTPLPTAGAPPANVPAPETVSNFGIKGVGPNPSAVSPFDTGVKPMIQGGDARYASTMGQLQPSVTAPIAPSGPVTPTPSSNPFMEGFASVKDFVKNNPLQSAVIGYAGLSALDSFNTYEEPTEETYINKYPISPNFRPSRPRPNVYRPRYAQGGITSFDDEAGVDGFAAGGSTKKERDADTDFKRYYSMMNARPEVDAGEEALRKPRFARDDDADTRYQDALTAALTRQKKNNARANIGSPSIKRPNPLGTINLGPPGTQRAASGGIMSGDLGGYSDGGRMLEGPGDGMSDSIPGIIGDKQPARLADGEFVVPADVVSHLGNGSTDAGAKKLYKMMDKIRMARTGTKEQAPEIKADKFLPVKTAASGGIAGYASGDIAGYASGGIAGYASGGVTRANVTKLYKDVLGREPDEAGLNYWVNSGQSLDSIRTAFSQTPEAQVIRLYQEQVGRKPDPEGLAYWANALATGTSLAEVSKGINTSLEGQNFDTQYITSLYRQNLARNPEQEGFQYWLSAAQSSGMTPAEIQKAIVGAGGKEQLERDIVGKTFTEMELPSLESDPYGGRYKTRSIYDIASDAVNVSNIEGRNVQFVTPVTQKAVISDFINGVYTAKEGVDIINTPQALASINVALANGTLSASDYAALQVDLDNARKSNDVAQTRAALAKPRGQVVIDAIYGQQIGEAKTIEDARIEAETRQPVLNANDTGYYQSNDVLTQAYKDAGVSIPFEKDFYKDVDTRDRTPNVVTPKNFQSKMNFLLDAVKSNPYKPEYQPINQDRAPLPASTRDPYSMAGLEFLYGQMMDQYGTRDPNRVNPATLTNNSVPYKPPVVDNSLLNQPIADATAPAPAPTSDTSGFFASPSGQIFASEAAYNASVPTQAKAGGLLSIKHKKRKA